jgi:hypothetical protein
MKKINQIKNCSSIYNIGGKIIWFYDELFTKIEDETTLKLSTSFRVNENFIGFIYNGKIDLYNNKFEIISTFENENILATNGLAIINEKSILVYGHSKFPLDNFLFINSNTGYYQIDDIYAIFLADKYLLEILKVDEKSYTLEISLKDLKNEITYLTYHTPPTYKSTLRNTFVWKDFLLITITPDVHSRYGGTLIKISIETGKVVWELDYEGEGFNFEESTGRMMSMYNREGFLHYQVVDIEKETYNCGKVNGDVAVESIPTHFKLQTVANNKIYFVESLWSYVGKKNCPKVGCFNLETLELEFLKEEKAERGGGFMQIIFNENKLYLVGTKYIMYEYEV